MARADAIRAVSRLVDAYQQDAMKPETIAVYVDELQNIDGDLLNAAATSLIRSPSRFFPRVGEVIEAAGAIAGTLPPTAAEVLALVRRADVRESVFRRDGSFAYEERYWRWPEDADPRTMTLAQDVLAKVGEPCDAAGKEHFAWDTGFQKTCEEMTETTRTDAMRSMWQWRLPPAERRLLT